MSNGLNDFATNGELRLGLRADFPAHQIVKVRKANNAPPVDTLSHAIITDRLNAHAPGWTYEILRFVEVEGIWVKPNAKRGETFEPYNDGQLHLLAVYGSFTIGSVTRYEVGEVGEPSNYGAELKRAISDFIKRGAMRFGVGISLKSKEIDAQLVEDRSVTAASDAAASSGARGSGPQGTAGEPEPSSDTEPERGPDPTTSAASPEVTEQWNRLLKVTGSAAKAANRLNRVNKTSYTDKTAPYATSEELAAAITGEGA